MRKFKPYIKNIFKAILLYSLYLIPFPTCIFVLYPAYGQSYSIPEAYE